MEYTNALFLTNALGAIAVLLGILSYQFKRGKTMIGTQAIMNTFWCAHYCFLGAFMGAAMNFIALFRNGLGYTLPENILLK